MKTGILTAFFLAASVPVLAQTAASQANLQQALGFENQTSTSLTGWYANPAGTVSADNSVAHTGHWSVRLQRDAQSVEALSVIMRSLPVDFHGSTVELRGYIKLQDVSGSAGFWLGQYAGGERVAYKNMEAQQVSGTHDWTHYSITLPISPQAQRLSFGVIVSGRGTVWADDLELLVDGKPIAEAASMPTSAGLPSDHEFDSGSRIVLDRLTPIQVSNLVTLGRVWGFLKYHHPAITSGQRHWDYELFRILPAILAAPDRIHANDALLGWIEKLGPVLACSACVPAPSGNLDIKPALDWIHDRSMLGEPLSQRLESIYAARTGKQFFVSLVPIARNPSFDHEPSYAQVAFPDSGYQLLALFRWWNIFQYWAPYRDVAGQDWLAVLTEFIPKLALAKDKVAYQLALFELIAKANDTHASLGNSLAARPPVGDCALPVTLRSVDNKPIVYRTDSADSPFRPGDILNSLDGVSIQSLIGKWAMYYADSNDAVRQRDLAANITRGACGAVSVEITRSLRPVKIAATRTLAKQDSTHDQPGETFRMLSPEVAYVKLSSIKTVDLPGYVEKAKNTKGLIVDIRNYPSEYVPYAMGAYFATKPTPFVTFSIADLTNPGAFHFGDGPLIEPGPVHYSGKVVILVDETSQSQAEYTAMALRAMPNSLVVGSTTAGADGNVSAIALPGNLSTMISGLGVFYPDHRPTQRIGIVPDVVVKPTVEGIAAGRDEVLEKAMQLIANSK
jgi:riboflavin biosynthesis pyrimidine reductase